VWCFNNRIARKRQGSSNYSKVNGHRGFASLLALLLTALLLSFSMGYFNAVRSSLRCRGVSDLVLLRKMFRTCSLPQFWEACREFEDGETRTVPWNSTWVQLHRDLQSGEYLSVEWLEVWCPDHPEWGRIQAIRVATEHDVTYVESNE